MSTIGDPDRARRLSLLVGLTVVGLAVALSVFIASQPRDLGPPEGVPRAVAIPALYATMGLLALMGSAQRRPAIVIAAGVLCFAGAILSVATIPFVVPGLLLIVLGARSLVPARTDRVEPLIAAVAGILVLGAAVAVLTLTETRCWQATGSPADPVYSTIPCGNEGGAVGSGATGGTPAFASGSGTGVLTAEGGLAEGLLLLGSLALTILTGGAAGDRDRMPSGDPAQPA